MKEYEDYETDLIFDEDSGEVKTALLNSGTIRGGWDLSGSVRDRHWWSQEWYRLTVAQSSLFNTAVKTRVRDHTDGEDLLVRDQYLDDKMLTSNMCLSNVR